MRYIKNSLGAALLVALAVGAWSAGDAVADCNRTITPVIPATNNDAPPSIQCTNPNTGTSTTCYGEIQHDEHNAICENGSEAAGWCCLPGSYTIYEAEALCNTNGSCALDDAEAKGVGPAGSIKMCESHPQHTPPPPPATVDPACVGAGQPWPKDD